MRSTSSIALHVLRVLEEALVKSSAHNVTLRTRTVVALYVLNQKRSHLQELEQRFGVQITLAADDSLTGAAYHALEKGELATGAPRAATTAPYSGVDSLSVEPLVEEEESAEEESESHAGEVEGEFETRREGRAPRPRGAETDGEGAPRMRRRRRRKGRGHGNGEAIQIGADQPSDEGLAFMAQIGGAPAAKTGEASQEAPRGGRSRRERPGRWTRSSPLPPEFRDDTLFPADASVEENATFFAPSEAHVPSFEPKADSRSAQSIEVRESQTSGEEAARSHSFEQQSAPAPEHASVNPHVSREPTEVVITEADPSRPKKGGWWQRAKATLGGG